jgi:electron transport complex protein RnfC
MAVLTFPGGVHPPERKGLSEKASLEQMPLPKSVYCFVHQNLGAPPKIICEVGQRVKTGQVLAEPSGPVSVPLHSPVTGIVKEIKKMLHPGQKKKLDVIVIEREEKEEWDLMEPMDFTTATRDDLYKRILDAGIVGLGGAAFPTHVKYTSTLVRPADLVIINGAECEPYLTIDHRFMLEKGTELLTGLRILMKVAGAKKGIIGIETNKPDAVKKMTEIAAHDNEIDVVAVKTKYPQGAEKQLIYTTTRRKVPVGGLPIDIGVVMNNVGTAIAVAQAVTKGKPIIDRGVTITGEGIQNPKNVIARIGTPISELIEFAGGYKGEPEKVIAGGPMTGPALQNTETPIMKSTSGVLVLPKPEKPVRPEKPCINCNQCVEVCPMALEPNLLVKLCKAKKNDEAVDMNLLSCIECGACAYICPARIDHIKTFQLTKKVYRAMNSKRRK